MFYIGKTELFYQKINRLGLKIHEVNGWQYKYSQKDDGLVYEREHKETSFFTVAVLVDLDSIESYSDSRDEFEKSLNESFSEEYARRVTSQLVDPKAGAGTLIVYA